MRFEWDLPLVEKDYVTPDAKTGWFARAFPTLSFYWHASNVVFSAANKAKRGKYDDKEWSLSSYNIVKALEKVGTRVEIENIEAVLGVDGPCVIVGNHMSTLETFSLPYLIAPHRPVTYVVKKSLVEYPVFKHVMRSRNPIVVGRENPREDLKAMINGGLERLKNGISIIVFPQTTRMTQFDPELFNSIGVKIAKKAGVPVVPLALKTDAWSNGKLLKDFGPVHPSRNVHFSFADPLEVTGNGSEQQEAIIAHIQSHLAVWQRQEGQKPLAAEESDEKMSV